MDRSGGSLPENKPGLSDSAGLVIAPGEQQIFSAAVGGLLSSRRPDEAVFSLFQHWFDDARRPDEPSLVINTARAVYRPTGTDMEEVKCFNSGGVHGATVTNRTPLEGTDFVRVVTDEYSVGTDLGPKFASRLIYENGAGLPVEPFGPFDPDVLTEQIRKRLIADYAAQVLAIANDTTFTAARLGRILAKLEQCTVDNRVP